MKKALLIVNPYSGKKDGEQQAESICKKLLSNNISGEVYVSRSIEGLHTFIENSSLSDFDLVGLIGGDGSMHAFINAALKKYEVIPIPVALFPCGTGNSFNFDIGCSSIDETLASIYSDKISFVDIAEVQGTNERMWSFNILGCGLVAEINKLAENMRWLGASRYTVASVIKLLANPHFSLKIKTEQGVLDERFSFVLACNTRYTGKGMLMAPHAKLNDGKFDVIIVKACSAIKLLKLFPKIFKGQHLGADVLEYLQVSSLEVLCTDKLLSTNIDGEMKGETPFTLRVQANKIRVFVQ